MVVRHAFVSILPPHFPLLSSSLSTLLLSGQDGKCWWKWSGAWAVDDMTETAALVA